MTKFSEYLQDKSDSRNLERSQKEIQRLRDLDNLTTERIARVLDEMIEVPCSKEQDEEWSNELL